MNNFFRLYSQCCLCTKLLYLTSINSTYRIGKNSCNKISAIVLTKHSKHVVPVKHYHRFSIGCNQVKGATTQRTDLRPEQNRRSINP